MWKEVEQVQNHIQLSNKQKMQVTSSDRARRSIQMLSPDIIHHIK